MEMVHGKFSSFSLIQVH